MEERDFFAYLQAQFDEALPFVVYRKPNEKQITALLQEDEELHEVVDFSESGFIFAPFDSRQEKTVLIPTEVSETVLYDSVNSVLSSSQVNSSLQTSSRAQDREKHIALVQKGIDVINNSSLKKVVLSRKQTIPHNYESPVQIFKRLASAYPTAFAYCWYHPKVGLWLGVTPETLLFINNRKLHTMALAGTQKFEGEMDVDWGAKEQEEQQYVTDSIVENLQELVNDLKVSNLQTHRAGTLLHLKTDISATINENETDLVSVINALHPTPAVCGLPQEMAKAFILENEGYKRSYYTGFLGELNIKTEKKRAATRRNIENLAYSAIRKNTHLFVNLRCMEIDAQGAQLYVGGGVTAASNPEAEWEETVNKLQTVGKTLHV